MTKATWESMPIDFKHRVGGNAIAVEVTSRKLAEAQRVAGKATGREQKAKERRDTAQSRAAEHMDTWTEAENSAVRISTNLLVNARIRAGNLQDRMSGLGEADPQYADLSSELANANADIASLESELTQWRDTAQRAQVKHNEATERLVDRQEAYDLAHGRATQATDQRETWSDTHDEDQARLHQTLVDTLKPQGNTEEDDD